MVSSLEQVQATNMFVSFQNFTQNYRSSSTLGGKVQWDWLSICKMSTNFTSVVSGRDLHPANKAIQYTSIMPAWNKHHHGDVVA